MAVRLTHSIQQGCPLSPLVFILAFDSLTQVFKYSVKRRAVIGVHFPKLNILNLLSMYADDFIVITRAQMSYVMECRRILQLFGAASSLHCIWEQTRAAFIPSGPSPPVFWLLPWTWEENSHASNMLGYPVTSHFSSSGMEEIVQAKLITGITRYKGCHLSLAAKVVVANLLILSTLWYLLTLLAGDLAFLTKIQQQINLFVWAGKSRVDRNTITQSKAKGGMGLLCVLDQFRSIAGNDAMASWS